jgi:hypothetical protein
VGRKEGRENMKGTRIALTDWQCEMLSPLFNELNDIDPKAIFAQIIKTENGGVLDCHLLNMEMAREIQKIVGQHIGEIIKKGSKIEFLTPLESEKGE